ncbi:hypothetical protein [Eikenella sp. Marseille-P7795]|uniref:hypothetical protein n=1 Tax=Eikenella sp. Marseille-P7795 TaxID=2866577 RepID=UPI001CE45E17|nr:hypothetical protein [Eikenella sp. Marseille-P7795]
MIYLALYHGHRGGTGWRVWAARFTDGLTRILTRGRYSHCELAVRLPETAGGQEYECYSASIRDKGVRMKTMPLPADKWDLIPLDDAVLHAHTVGLYLRTAGQGYDLMGALGIWSLAVWLVGEHLQDMLRDERQAAQTVGKKAS